MKKFFAILLTCAMIFSTLPIMAFAEDAGHGHDDATGNVATEIQCKCDEKVVDPSEYQGHVEANCVSISYDLYLCGTCGYAYTQAIGGVNPTKHIGTRTVAEKAATCTEDGYTAYEECYYVHEGEIVSCGWNNKVVVPATGHDYTDNVTDPTCTDDGYTTHTCNNCGDTYDDTVVGATGHDYVATVTDATCTTGGYTTHVCNNCGDSYTDTPVDATGHHYQPVVTPPTCTADGYTTYTCPDCGDSYVSDTTGALGHTMIEVGRVEADCYNNGIIYYACACGETRQETIFASMEHTYTVTEIPATCTEPAKLYHVCEVCGSELTVNKPGSTALGHTETPVYGTPAQCESDGLTDGVYCTTCATFLVPQVVIPALGHTAGTPVEENRVDAECEADGSYDTVVYCSVCDAELSRTTNTISALGHTAGTPVEENRVDADCVNDGSYESVVYCSVCDAELSRTTNTISALGHTPVTDNAVEPTCQDTGLTEGSHCEVCDAVLVPQTVLPPNPGAHRTVITKDKIDATCVSTGYTHEVTCELCGVVAYPEIIPVNPDAHKYSASVTDPTCTTDGYTTYTCDYGCGSTYTDNVVPAYGHNYDDDVTDPTCTDQGYTTHTCTVCNYSYVDSYVVALGHTAGVPVEENRVEADCVTDGSYESVVYCSVCDEELSRTTITLVAPGHDLEYVDAEAQTCTTIGWNAYEYCKVDGCGYTTYVQIDPNGHTHGQTAGIVNPTCEEGGYSICVCSVCNEIFITDLVDALGHKDDDTDHICDRACGKNDMGDHIDADLDHACDYGCNDVIGTCADADLDHACDYGCDAVFGTCADADLDHACDYGCDFYYGVHADADLDHACDYGCNDVIGTCADADLDHACDYGCDMYFGVHADSATDADHVCDYGCNEILEDCDDAENDGDHACDVCGAVVTTCTYVDATCEVPATCTECGGTTGSALGHTEVIDDEVAPTFDTTGLTEGKHCSVCNKVLVAQQVIPTLNEMLTFSYEAVGINGVANATNSGYIKLNVYVTVNELYADVVAQARFWGVDLKIEFEDYVNLVTVDAAMFPVLHFTPVDIANDGNFVMISSNLNYMVSDNATFTGTIEFASLTFKVADDCFKKDVKFNVTECEVIRNEEANTLTVNTGIVDDAPEAVIYVALLGDANLDGKISGADSLEMSKWSTSDAVAADENAYDTVYDMNKDGVINGLDFILLGKAVVGNDEYLG